MSQVGAQQGDPCGPLAFSLSIQPIIEAMSSELNIWYLDDGTICGEPTTVLSDFRKLIDECDQIGLKINASKCEMFFCDQPVESVVSNFNTLSPGIKIVTEDLELLGAPLTEISTKKFLNKKHVNLTTLLKLLGGLKHHIAFYILRHCFAIPKLMYILRTSACFVFEEELNDMDCEIKATMEKLVNSQLNFDQWTIYCIITNSQWWPWYQENSRCCTTGFLKLNEFSGRTRQYIVTLDFR